MLLELTISCWILIVISLSQSNKRVHPYLCYPSNPITGSNSTSITSNTSRSISNLNYYNKTHESHNTASEYNPHNLAIKAVWCYDVDIHPKLNEPVRVVVPIQNVQRNDNSEWNIFSVYFAINDHECVSPKVSFEYEVVNDDTYALYNDDERSINKINICGTRGRGHGHSRLNCGEIEQCLHETSVYIDPPTSTPIPVDHLYKISVYQHQMNADADAQCNSDFAINAKLTFSCSAAAPTTTTECNHINAQPMNHCYDMLSEGLDNTGGQESYKYVCVDQHTAEDRYYSGFNCNEAQLIDSVQFECTAENNCYCSATDDIECDTVDIAVTECEPDQVNQAHIDTIVVDHCLTDAFTNGSYSYHCADNGEFVWQSYDNMDCQPSQFQTEHIFAVTCTDAMFAVTCNVNQQIETVDRITSDCSGNEIERETVVMDECQFESFPNGPSRPFKYFCDENNELGLKYYGRGSDNCNGAVDLERILDSSGVCVDEFVFSSTCGGISIPTTTKQPTSTTLVTRLCEEELDDFNVGATYYGTGGCEEHFTARLDQDTSGTASFADCLAKCKKNECKSFSFGRKGVSRQNWCHIYSLQCTLGSDNDWYMFTSTPINNAQLICNSI